MFQLYVLLRGTPVNFEMLCLFLAAVFKSELILSSESHHPTKRSWKNWSRNSIA